MGKTIVFAIAALLLTSCGGEDISKLYNHSGASVDNVKTNVTLYMFSTPKCEACETLLPAIQRGIDQNLSAVKGHITSTVYVVTSENGFGKPTAQTASDYKSKHNLTFNTLADYWRTGFYNTYYGSDSLRVPGVVILSSDGTNKIFANDEAIDPNEVLTYLQFQLR